MLLLGDGFLRSVRDCVVETLLIVASWWLGAQLCALVVQVWFKSVPLLFSCTSFVSAVVVLITQWHSG